MTATVFQRLSQATPSYNLQETPRALTSQFGDGYKQTTPDGLTPVDRTLTVTWDGIPDTEVQALINFFQANAGNAISFATPRETAPRQWLAQNWQRTSPYPHGDTLTATFVERLYTGPII